jgi:peptidoglycan/LPS O-acetylase OafA/YrhL
MRRLAAIFELQDPLHARNLPMEGLRGLAVTLVFLQHYGFQSLSLHVQPGYSQVAARYMREAGNSGVELFFVLSGYLIYGTLIRNAPRFGTFMWRRAQRLYPAFLVVFAFACCIAVLAPGDAKIPAGAVSAMLYLAANLAFLPGLFPIVPIVAVAWSLSYEMFFYLATAALVLGGGMAGMARPTRLAIIGVLVWLFMAAEIAGAPGLPIRMAPFFAGILLAEGLGAGVPAWLGLAAPAAAGACLALLAMPAALHEGLLTAALFALCAVCFRGIGTASRLAAWAPLRWLGNMSYSYYLIHGFAVRAAFLAFAHVWPHGFSIPVFWIAILPLYGVTLLAGAILFVTVEKPLSLSRPPGPGRPRNAVLESWARSA